MGGSRARRRPPLGRCPQGPGASPESIPLERPPRASSRLSSPESISPRASTGATPLQHPPRASLECITRENLPQSIPPEPSLRSTLPEHPPSASLAEICPRASPRASAPAQPWVRAGPQLHHISGSRRWLCQAANYHGCKQREGDLKGTRDSQGPTHVWPLQTPHSPPVYSTAGHNTGQASQPWVIFFGLFPLFQAVQ